MRGSRKWVGIRLIQVTVRLPAGPWCSPRVFPPFFIPESVSLLGEQELSVKVPEICCGPLCAPEWIRRQPNPCHPGEPSWVRAFDPRITQKSVWAPDMLRSNQILITYIPVCGETKDSWLCLCLLQTPQWYKCSLLSLPSHCMAFGEKCLLVPREGQGAPSLSLAVSHAAVAQVGGRDWGLCGHSGSLTAEVGQLQFPLTDSLPKNKSLKKITET